MRTPKRFIKGNKRAIQIVFACHLVIRVSLICHTWSEGPLSQYDREVGAQIPVGTWGWGEGAGEGEPFGIGSATCHFTDTVPLKFASTGTKLNIIHGAKRGPK
uniref:Uncharacterized protein n=1 Tax=Timema bartmani TaxID=61472 RepID=A0A7R9HVY1_9NEOP|nr:unnamed protein product [Timema bartmani]